ncbi:MAG TPA: gamma-glutamyltransferase [Acidimicrobiales bacterium]|nr:gamma-glutamyltransferase [Acidimicrobiales bacterium]
MSTPFVPYATTYAPHGMVCSVDHLASSAGIGVLRDGGTAVDAAIAASAVLAVTTQHMCGMGGDLFALVHTGSTDAPDCVYAAGRAPSGASTTALRAEGHVTMPFRDHLGPVTVPGCIDGWITLHERHGRLGLDRVLADAVELADEGFPASVFSVFMIDQIRHVPGADAYLDVRAVGDRVRRSAVAAHLRAIVEDGRDGWYLGAFGEALLDLGGGLFTADDLTQSQAEWVAPLGLDVFGHHAWTVPPVSQGYLSLAGCWIAERTDLGTDPNVGRWAHLMAESARVTGHDRPDVLFDGADGAALLAEDRLRRHLALIDPDVRTEVPELHRDGGTIHLATADRDGMAVSLIQSNASGWGAHLIAAEVFLHNRGNAFVLDDDHPAAYAPGRRPPHTLSPALVTNTDGSLRAVLGTMGGDSQPQIIQQLLTRLLHHGQDPAAVVAAPRVLLSGGTTGFDLWAGEGPTTTKVEAHAPPAWAEGLANRGHVVETEPAFSSGAGHAHVIEVTPSGGWRGASDPRAYTGSASGH